MGDCRAGGDRRSLRRHARTQHPPTRLVAVGSRSPQRAARFAEQFNAPLHGGYDIVGRPEVDVVYIAAVTPSHADLALRAIETG